MGKKIELIDGSEIEITKTILCFEDEELEFESQEKDYQDEIDEQTALSHGQG